MALNLGLGLGLGLDRGGISPSVFIPSGVGFDTTTFPISPYINDPGGMARATGSAGTTPEAMFDSASNVRTNPEIVYYVGPGGSDGNNGTSYATRLASIGSAITKANAAAKKAQVLIDAAEMPRALGPAGVIPLYDIAFEAVGGKVNVGTFDSFGTFTLDGTFTNCYSLALTNVDRVCNRLLQSVYGTNVDNALQASPTALNNATVTQDMWAVDASKVYIRRLDGAVPTPTNTRIYRSSVILFKFTTAVNVWVNGIDAEGGDTVGSFNYLLSSQSALTRVFVAKNCSAKYAGGRVNTSAKGFGFDSMKGLAYLYGCEGSANATDGINFHDNQNSGLMALTVNCSGTDNGRGISQSNNGLTSHEGIPLIDIAGYYPNNRGGSVRCVGTSKTLCAGTYSSDLGDVIMGGSTGPTAFQTDVAAQMWCDRTKADVTAAQQAYMASTNTSILKRNIAATPGIIGGGGINGTY